MKVCPVCQREYHAGATHCTDDGVPLVAMVADSALRSEDLLGQIVEGRYKIERIIGKGGMGTVYACRHVVVGKSAAMKVLRPNSDRAEGVLQRFVQEAKTANLLRSRHIVEVNDFGQLPSGSFFVVMELLEGKDLARAMRDGIGRAELVHVFMQVAETLQLAHDKGIVHRDLKPDNVFLVHDDGDPYFVKLLDFGIAKILHGESNGARTETGVVLGTPYYMSPEQARADALDHRSDIYSLGVMMYRAFTGRLPFVADSTMGVLTRHITEAPQPPSTIANVDQGTEQLILRCLAKRPEYRFQSMRELAAALQHVPLGPVPMLREQTTVHEGPAPVFQAQAALRASSGANPAVRAATPPGAAYTPSGPYPQAMSGPHAQQAASGPYAAQMASGPHAQGPSGAYAQAPQMPSSGYAQAPRVPSGAYAQAPQMPSGPYPQAASGAHAQAGQRTPGGVPVIVGVAPGAASTGTLTALHPQGSTTGNAPVGGEIPTQGVMAASVQTPSRGSSTALLVVGGLGMAAFGAAAVLFLLSKPAAQPAGGVPAASATAAPAATASATATATATASASATANAVTPASASPTAEPAATAPKIHAGAAPPKPAATATAAPATNSKGPRPEIRSPFE